MTRKDALNYAISTILAANGDPEAVQLLRDMLEEMPIHHWTKKSMFDACNQWIQDNGFLPTAKRLDDVSCLPSHTTIKTHFNMTYLEFLDHYYARPEERYIPQYGSKPTSEWLRLFREEYQRIKPTSQLEFDRQRMEGIPRCATFVRKFSPDGKFETFITLLGLQSYKKERKRKKRRMSSEPPPKLKVKVIVPGYEHLSKEAQKLKLLEIMLRAYERVLNKDEEYAHYDPTKAPKPRRGRKKKDSI